MNQRFVHKDRLWFTYTDDGYVVGPEFKLWREVERAMWKTGCYTPIAAFALAIVTAERVKEEILAV